MGTRRPAPLPSAGIPSAPIAPPHYRYQRYRAIRPASRTRARNPSPLVRFRHPRSLQLPQIAPVTNKCVAGREGAHNPSARPPLGRLGGAQTVHQRLPARSRGASLPQGRCTVRPTPLTTATACRRLPLPQRPALGLGTVAGPSRQPQCSQQLRHVLAGVPAPRRAPGPRVEPAAGADHVHQ